MKTTYLIISFLLLSLSVIAQAETIFVMGAEFGVVTSINDSTFQVDIDHPADQLGQGYLPTQILTGDRLFDINGRLFRVSSIIAANFGESTLQVVELQDNNIGPVGVGVVYRKPTDSDCVPIIPQGNTGLSPAIVAKIHNHNTLSNCGGGTDDQTASEVPIVDAGGYYVATEVEAALQEEAVNRIAVDLLVGDLISLTGVPFSSTTLGTFINPILLDNAAIKPVFEAFADSVTARLALDLDIDPMNELQTSETLPATPFGVIVSTDVQGQLEEILSKIPGATSGGNVLFVSQGTGSNVTARVGNQVFPFADPWAARDTALSQGVVDPFILLLDGDWSYCGSGVCSKVAASYEDLSLIRDGFTYYANPGVVLRGVNSTGYTPYQFNLFNDFGEVFSSFRFLGFADLIYTAGTGCLLGNDGADVTLQFNEVQHLSNNDATFQISSRNFYPGTTITKGGLGSFELRIEEYTISGGNAQMFGLWGNVTTDTTELNLSINVGKVFSPSLRNFVAFDPIFYKGSFFFRFDEINNTDASSELANTLWAGFIDSDVTFDIGRLKSETLFGLETGSNNAARDKSINSKFRYNISDFEGRLRAFNGKNLNVLDSNIVYTYNISGRQSASEVLYNLPTIGNSTISYEITGNVISNAPIFDIPSTRGELYFYNSSYRNVSTGAMFTVSSTRTEPFIFSNVTTLSDANSDLKSSPIISLSSVIANCQNCENVTRYEELGLPVWNSETFTATAAQVDFTVSAGQLPADGANVSVYDDTGAKLRETDHYTYVAATGVVTLVTPATAGEKYTIEYFQ